jgi:hypothetical protein
MQFANNSDADFKFEVVISSLIEQGYDPELIHILREGLSRRSVSNDIENVYRKYNNEDFKEYLHIHVNREGLYDILPEGLFHKHTYKRGYKDIRTDVEKALDEIKIHREQEFFARRFFQLFEQVIDNTLTDIYQAEIRYDWNTKNRDFVDLFIQYWQILKRLKHQQAVAFMYVIPWLSNIRLNFDEMGESLSFILDVPVKIEKIKLPAKKADSMFESHLGDTYLGVDLVLGNKFDDGINDLKITIGYLSVDRMRGFLETAYEYNVLIELLTIFLPDEAFSTIEFKIDPADSVFMLSDENHSTYLSINSFT